ncbi:MAG: DUF3568 family protein [Syntrophaceae bacterium]|nr:DUF3568 family protein [Syntrophaceae bacterium]
MKTFIVLLSMATLVCGCGAAINLQGKVASISSGKFLYQDGNLVTEYKSDIDAVWNACEKTMNDLRASETQKERKISSGVIKGVVQDEKVTITVQYVSLTLTSVSVFVGVTGNNIASRLIHDKIAGYLAKP